MAEPERKKIRILVADDHPPFALGLSKLLNEQPDLEPEGGPSSTASPDAMC